MDWDARTYNRISEPHQAWGEAILDRLALRGDETALDAGCGSGRVTRMLLERLPRGRVYGVDVSSSMLAVAAEQLASYRDQVHLLQADLTAVTLPEPVDVIFSNATFHWIPDHEALFRNLFSLLAPGGVLVAQCGGDGNVSGVVKAADAVLKRAPFAENMGPVVRVWRYASAEETRRLLEGRGFVDVETWLNPDLAPFPNREAYFTYLHKVVLGPYLDRLPAELHAQFTGEVVDEAERCGLGHVVDYVRLNLTGRRPA